MDYKKLIIESVVKELCERAGKVAAEAVACEILGDKQDADKHKAIAEKLEYAAKIYAESGKAGGDAKDAAAPMTWGGGAKFGASKSAGSFVSASNTAPIDNANDGGFATAQKYEYTLADICEALRDQLPVEDKRLEAQAVCLEALACINDKRCADAAEVLRRFAWMGGKASATAGVVADLLQQLA